MTATVLTPNARLEALRTGCRSYLDTLPTGERDSAFLAMLTECRRRLRSLQAQAQAARFTGPAETEREACAATWAALVFVAEDLHPQLVEAYYDGAPDVDVDLEFDQYLRTRLGLS